MKNTFSDQKTSQRKRNEATQRQSAGPDGVSVAPPNRTGLPDTLKTGIESLSGLSLDDVRVHYNSSKPQQLQALAYAQGTDIHVAPGQERHLPHEAWHVVQQAQGRVKPTAQMKGGVSINDNQGLEHEADLMGVQALTAQKQPRAEHGKACSCASCSSASLTSSTQLKTSSQQKWQARNQSLNGAHHSDCKCSSCNTATSTVAVQRKEHSAYSPVQLAKCLVCAHEHGSSTCKTKVPDPNNKGKTKKCGCKSHSSHWGKGSKINPGSGRRARRLAALTEQ